jgi:hypothetical protein
MQPYQEADGTSGIEGYETGEDYIRVRFRDGTEYVYTHESTGSDAVDRMKELAAADAGSTRSSTRTCGPATHGRNRSTSPRSSVGNRPSCTR